MYGRKECKDKRDPSDRLKDPDCTHRDRSTILLISRVPYSDAKFGLVGVQQNPVRWDHVQHQERRPHGSCCFDLM